jgi:tetratricopeptide (TPR) repeat protein
LAGDWKKIKGYDDDLVNKNLSIGEIYWASQHFHWHGLHQLYQGYLDIPKLLVDKLNDIYEVYENDFSVLLKLLVNTSLLLGCRKLLDALNEIKAGIDFGQKTNNGLFLIHIFSCKAQVHILMDDIKQAEKYLARADKISREVVSVPWQLSQFCRGQSELDLYRLNESIRSGNKTDPSEYRKQALDSCRKFLKQSQKVAQHRTEAFRLMGEYYWLVNKQKAALKWWHRSIKEGERLGARLELSRTYFEVGVRLLEAESKFKALNGIKAQEYLAKARALFEEMDLQWDLAELERVAGN